MFCFQYALTLLTLLIVQVAIVIYLMVAVESVVEEYEKKTLEPLFNSYDTNEASRNVLDAMQSWVN